MAALETDADLGINTAAVTRGVQYWMLYLPLVEKDQVHLAHPVIHRQSIEACTSMKLHLLSAPFIF